MVIITTISASAGTIFFDDFDKYSAEKSFSGASWNVKFDQNDESQRNLFLGSSKGFAYLNGQAKSSYISVSYRGFYVNPGEHVTISSDFQYKYIGGGIIKKELRSDRAFGFVLSTAPFWYKGEKVDFCLVNRGDAFGNRVRNHPYLEGWVLHDNLGVDVSVGGFSDWFSIDWTISNIDNELFGKAVVRKGDAILHTSSLIDLGFSGKTKLFAGYTTGFSQLKGTLVERTNIEEIRVDNFKVMKK